MENEYSVEALLDFLNHASQRGLMPAATATSLAVGARSVLGVLDEKERIDLRKVDIEKTVKRFTNKRARDFNPASLKEYTTRTRRAIEHFLRWRDDPANFSVRTRTTNSTKKGKQNADPAPLTRHVIDGDRMQRVAQQDPGGYDSAFPVRPGRVVTISNIPDDLTNAEAERLSQFIKMLAIE